MDLNKYNKKIVTLISIFVISFILNFIWEAIHSPYLYLNHNMPAKEFIDMLFYVSFVDAFLIVLMFVVTAFIFREFNWVNKIISKENLMFIVVGTLIALIVEFRAIVILNRWTYSELMPTVIGVGISPLIQLSITGIIAVHVTKKLLS